MTDRALPVSCNTLSDFLLKIIITLVCFLCDMFCLPMFPVFLLLTSLAVKKKTKTSSPCESELHWFIISLILY